MLKGALALTQPYLDSPLRCAMVADVPRSYGRHPVFLKLSCLPLMFVPTHEPRVQWGLSYRLRKADWLHPDVKEHAHPRKGPVRIHTQSPTTRHPPPTLPASPLFSPCFSSPRDPHMRSRKKKTTSPEPQRSTPRSFQKHSQAASLSNACVTAPRFTLHPFNLVHLGEPKSSRGELNFHLALIDPLVVQHFSRSWLAPDRTPPRAASKDFRLLRVSRGIVPGPSAPTASARAKFPSIRAIISLRCRYVCLRDARSAFVPRQDASSRYVLGVSPCVRRRPSRRHLTKKMLAKSHLLPAISRAYAPHNIIPDILSPLHVFVPRGTAPSATESSNTLEGQSSTLAKQAHVEQNSFLSPVPALSRFGSSDSQVLTRQHDLLGLISA